MRSEHVNSYFLKALKDFLPEKRVHLLSYLFERKLLSENTDSMNDLRSVIIRNYRYCCQPFVWKAIISHVYHHLMVLFIVTIALIRSGDNA